MRTLFVFCAVALGMGCDASATEQGLASFYGVQGLTAAHRSLPMGSRVKVLNLDNGRSVIVRIVDRGPFIRGRIIDVSTAAAVTLGFRDAGLAHVRIERISAETLEASAGPSRPAAPASDETSSYAICSYGADRVEHFLTDTVGDRAAPLSGDALGCDNFRLQLVRFAESTDDLAPVVAALTKVGSSGLERAKSISVSGVADMEAAESIPVGALAEVLQRKATRSASHCAAASRQAAERPHASSIVYSLFAELRGYQAFDLDH
jgi:rare lipoprotein A